MSRFCLMISLWMAASWLALAPVADAATSQPLLLLRHPTMSKTVIVFEYGGELWEVPRTGGRAHVLASGMDLLAQPILSPDGRMVAFSGTYDHNTDVYVVPVTGGQPRRLTWHPGPDVAVGWTPDGKSVLFRSHRHSPSDPDQLYTVPVDGGFPAQLPLAMAESGSYSADGSHLAFVPNFQWEPFWKKYKGGQHTKIWVARLSDSHTVRIPNRNANEDNPMWVGHDIYFLSDRDGPITLFDYDVDSHKVTKVIDNKGFDITSASAGPGGIVYSQFGQLHIHDYATGKNHVVAVTLDGDLPQRRPYYQDVAKKLKHPTLSPHGVRAAFQAHGDILSVPASHGSAVNLTHSAGAMDRDPSWSPDGKSVAYFSDRDGEYDLYVRPQKGGRARKIALGQDDAFYYHLTWSPDSSRLLFYDQKLQLWYVNLKASQPKPVKVATDNYMPMARRDAAWSPDSRWITYTRVMPNYLHAVYVYSLADGRSHKVSDAGADCEYPQFEADGKYLYFAASTNTALTSGWLSMSSMEHPVTYRIYAAVLEADGKSPLALKSGFEGNGSSHADKDHGDHDKSGKTPTVRIDFAGIGSRTVALPVDAANYKGMTAGKPGELYLEKGALVEMPGNMGQGMQIKRFTLDDRKTKTLQKGVSDFVLAANGEKMLYRKGKNWFIADAGPKAKPDKLDTSNLKVHVEPRKQWAQMFHDTWRIERGFFYNPHFDGLDIDAAEAEFAHYLPGIASRDGLTFLFREMLSYLSVGHMFVRGGYVPKMQEIKVGLLGANYRVEHDHYRITRIFDAGRWNPRLHAPLAQPGVQVKVGDYLLAVNGHRVDAGQSIYQAFVDLAGKTVTLTVGPNPDMHGSHDITVKTIPSERKLRHVAWIRHNMQLVNKLSDGKLGYVYLPDTYWGGFTNFNRYFFSQVDKQGVVIDERFNHGGDLSDYIINWLTRKPMALGVTRWGKRKTSVLPPMAIYGPKVMLINQFSGSGGDALPWYFKMADVGTLVGQRTWGGLVGISGYPELMDGGSVTAPRFGVEGLHGHFPVENHGVSPDVKVWQDPQKLRQGQDPQLERAVDIALKKLHKHPAPTYQRPPWRNYHPHLPPLPKPASATTRGAP